MPWLLLTGTKDLASIERRDISVRFGVYPALPAPDKYEVVFADADHAAFGDHEWEGRPVTRNPNHHRAIQALTTAFWDSYLQRDQSARAWLQGSGAASVLETGDRWQQK